MTLDQPRPAAPGRDNWYIEGPFYFPDLDELAPLLAPSGSITWEQLAAAGRGMGALFAGRQRFRRCKSCRTSNTAHDMFAELQCIIFPCLTGGEIVVVPFCDDGKIALYEHNAPALTAKRLVMRLIQAARQADSTRP